ncbi:hypothetical protein LTS18_001124, partial [Coniosporium uncinatum]
MSTPQRPNASSPRRHRHERHSSRRRNSHGHRPSFSDGEAPVRHSSRRRRPSDVESRPYDSPAVPSTPTRKGNYNLNTYSHQSPMAPRSPSEEEDPMMANARGGADFARKKSLVRPERSRIDRDHPNYYYRKHAQGMAVQPSTTGSDPVLEDRERDPTISSEGTDLKSYARKEQSEASPFEESPPDEKRREKHRLERHKSGHAKGSRKLTRRDARALEAENRRRQREMETVPAPNVWNFYCALITFWAPDPILRCFGKVSKAQQRAWREKIGLISIILCIATFVGFLTFGFTQTVCPAGGGERLKVNNVDTGYMIFHGKAYNLLNSEHPLARGIPADSNVLYDLPE